MVWTDHKNLKYICSAKRLNTCQARWALFFGRFKFALTYIPGSRNTKPDALSCLFEREEVTAEPDTIIPKTCIIGAATWEVEREVRAALRHHPDPGNGPPGCLFVPPPVRSSVLQWGHSSKLSCHPGVVRRHFWWPEMRTDVQTFNSACSVCAQNKGFNTPPAGFLQPLSIPQRPWSHLSLDFISGLLPSKGMTVVLTVVDRFSKFACYLPLPKLPTARETLEKLLVSVIFTAHGLPLDIISDRGPQFTSAVWKSFCRAIGATASLISGFHPQADGQAERANQKLETTLCCLASSDPTSWVSQLPWVEYAHNTLPTSATGLSPFQCVYSFQPPLFPSQERELTVPSVQAYIRRCHRT